jgi:hypothetical protein
VSADVAGLPRGRLPMGLPCECSMHRHGIMPVMVVTTPSPCTTGFGVDEFPQLFGWGLPLEPQSTVRRSSHGPHPNIDPVIISSDLSSETRGEALH